jgi:ATP-dependent RNA helicase RhlE
MSFQNLGLNADLLRGAAELGFVEPTRIQSEAIPLIMTGRDIQAQAQTGSGKTLAYTLALLQGLLADSTQAMSPLRTKVLILVPTRELASQVGEVIRSVAQFLPRKYKIAVLFGGVSVNPQMMALRGGADIVVATPGRLLDLVSKNALKLTWINALVLDEADRLLELGFSDELEKVLALIPKSRQNLFFSATFPSTVQALVDHILVDAATLTIPEDVRSGPKIEQRVYEVNAIERTQLLVNLVRTQGWSGVLVFVATRYAAEHVAMKLQRAKIYATAFHGDLSQGARTEALDGLREGGWQVVVTTDLAARGIDIMQLPVVINYDLPRSPTDYTHRIGRTGRAGASGLAISFVSPATEAHFRLIEKRQGLSLPREQLQGFEVSEQERAAVRPPDLTGNGGIKGKRPNKKDKLRAAQATTQPGETPATPVTSTKLS